MRMPATQGLDYGATREVKVSVAERFTRAGLAGWLPFLAIGLALVGTSVALWAYNNTLVAWALSRGMVDEGATRTLPSSLRHASVAGAVLGVTALSLAPPGVRLGIAIVAGNLRVGLYTITVAVGALLSYLWLGVTVVLGHLRLTISILLRYARQVLSAIIRPFWLGVIAITGAVGVALGYLRARVSTVTRYSRLRVSGACKLLAGLAAILVLIPLYYAGTGMSSFFRQARPRVAITARYASISVSAIAAAVGALLHYLWLGIAIVARYLWLGLSTVAVAVGTLLHYLWLGIAIVAGYLWLGVSAVAVAVGAMLRNLWLGVTVVARHLWLGLSAIAAAVGALLRYLWLGVAIVARPLWLGFYTIAVAVGAMLRYLWLGVTVVARYLWLGLSAIALAVGALLRYLWLGVAIVARHLWAGVSTVAVAVGALLRYLWLGIAIVAGHLWLGLSRFAVAVGALLRYLWLGIAIVAGHLWRGLSRFAVAVGAILRYLWLGITVVARHLWVGVSAIALAAGAMLRYLWLGIAIVARHLLLGLATTARHAGLGLSRFAVAVGAILRYLWLGVTVVARHLWLGLYTIAVAVGAMLRYLWLGIAIVARHLWLGLSTVAVAVGAMLRYLWLGIAIVARHLWVGLSAIAAAVGALLGYLWLGVAIVARHLWVGVSAIALAVGALLRYLWPGIAIVSRHVWLGVSTVAVTVGALLRYLWLGIAIVAGHLWLGVSTVAVAVGLALRYLGRGGYAALGYPELGVSTMGRPIRLGLSAFAHYAWMGVSTAAVTLVWALGAAGLAMSMVLRGLGSTASFAMRTVSTGSSTVPDVFRFGVRLATPRKEASSMSELNLTRERVLSLIATIWMFGIVGLILGAVLWPAPPEPRVVVTHWATGHLTRDGLLKDMAKEFNKAGHRIGGKRIVVEVYDAPSELQGKYLSELLKSGTRRDLHKETNGYVVKNIPDPIIVTPSSAHWLVTTNYEVGSPVVDLDAAESIVRPVIGIVTFEEMAKCLGWPEKKIGFADIIALRNDPLGWERYPCARAEWGRRPLLAFTDPTTSSTGRSLHLALYSFAANKPPQDLTVGDVNDPEVVAYVKEFQRLIDHYLIGTTVLNTKIHQGPRYGHFFIMPEDNLIHLYEGTEKSYMNGIKTTAPPIEQRMVMIYPKEGSMPRKNCACIVQAHWVSEEQVEASQQWIDFIREDEQQRAFMAAGFRPGTDLALDFPGSKISSEFGLNPEEPRVVLNPSMTRPDVAAAIDQNWEQVKRPGIVTFVVDTSGSMMGTKLTQAKDGLVRALDTMARNNQVGLVTFDDAVNTRVPVAPLSESRFEIAEAAEKMRARGETALYDAIKAAIEMTDAAAPGDRDAIRGVVVLTDGLANRGAVRLDDLIQMMSCNERHIETFDGMKGDLQAVERGGSTVAKECVIGTDLAFTSRHPVQIFFIGIGDDADLQVGRIIAQATGAEFQGVAEEDLARVLAEFSRYF